MEAAISLREKTKAAVRAVVPLAARKAAARWLDRQRWLPAGRWWAVELVRDLAERDPDAYHRFLWRHHLGYAATYEVAERFGADRIHPTRLMLFADVRRVVAASGCAVESVFEVGCSMGYLLRHVETDVFPAAATLEGLDIDRRAVAQGSAWLAAQGSRVRLVARDMSELDTVLAGRRFDLVLCAGVLMYLGEAAAAAVVRTMLVGTRHLVALAGLAHPDRDNRELGASEVRRRDGTFIHNLDDLVSRAGGRVVYRRWEGPRVVDGNTIYFVFAEPDARAASSGRSQSSKGT
jgi:SAM-dependent methyltransferase